MENILNKIIKEAIKNHFAPCIALRVTHNGEMIYNRAYGHHTYDSISQPINTNAIFDIASVTKIVVATGVLLLIDKGLLRLSDPLLLFFLELSGVPTGNITLQRLLTHTSGLHEIQMSAFGEELTLGKIIDSIYFLNINKSKVNKVEYANINTFLLGEIIEKVSNDTLDVFLQENVFEPLTMVDTMFNPSKKYWDRIPPTSIDQDEKLSKVVHDPSARRLNGICGHAGLFSTVVDLSNLLEMWRNGGVFKDKQILSPSLIAQATHNQTEGYNLKTGLGWHLDNNEYLGSLAPKGTFFHPGFTGSIIAVSPEKQLTISLLSNHTFSEKNDPFAKKVLFRSLFDSIFRYF